ncbi:putative metal-dependent HD superfamily phosphohydrolase [Larkinella arboricola]|uniref:Putative metal-dependent HD superfamily phosphohydrolase n=1 Tax=Larkinella arboricola TaxID=643671 RepID=A0A327WLK1_LARAB|nr:Pycsar system effector family protein [Larkinella arboricola]RAJ92635.1 putative metal-dependent HD superfamily phosphohydrolase [Larkinella arboricola]
MLTEISLLNRTRDYAETLLRALPAELVYHNLNHTQQVAEAAELIGKQAGLDPEEMENAIIAAWLHDIGYARKRHQHEAAGVDMARPFLEELGLSEDRIQDISDSVLATQLPQNPRTRVAEVVCDADLFHLSSDRFFDRSELMRQEVKNTTGKIGKKKWLQGSIKLMECHHYFTEYGKTVLTPLKEKNLEKARKKLAELEAEDDEKAAQPLGGIQLEDEPKKPKRPDRGVETMFRVTSQNHFQLSAMADNKANIMISVNTIIVSLIVSILIRKLEEWPQLIIPTVMLTASSLVATIFAILATRPHITSGRFSKEDIHNKQANLLFFGNFHKMDLVDYEWGMREMMNDADFLYSSMTRDIYYLGKVLGKKYRLLRIAYTTFMFGFAASVLAFGIAAYFFPIR